MSFSQMENDLYQQVILDHNRKPKNFREIPDSSCSSEGYNPLCGDHIWVYLKLDSNGVIEDVSFSGSGCAISKASASMMTISLIGKTQKQAKDMFFEFQQLITGKLEEANVKHLGKLKIFSGVCRYPSRVKCAGLAWHTMYGALMDEKVVSTEKGEGAL